jgi:hypothetical protein
MPNSLESMIECGRSEDISGYIPQFSAGKLFLGRFSPIREKTNREIPC